MTLDLTTLSAEADRTVLLVLQGLDYSGENGTIEHVVIATIPAGVRTGSQTTASEPADDGMSVVDVLRRAVIGFVVLVDRSLSSQPSASQPSASQPSASQPSASQWWSLRSIPRSVWLVPIFLALLVAAGRVYEGVHHPTDVAAGLLLGIGAVVAASVATGLTDLRNMSGRTR